MADTDSPLAAFLDAWSSPNGAGGAYDKRSLYALIAGQLGPLAGANLYNQSDVAQIVVDAPVREALREPWEIETDDEEQAKRDYAALEDLHATETVAQAVRVQRATGGAGILLLSNDADLSKPWGPGSKLKGLLVCSPVELRALTEYVSSLDSPSFGLPAYYDFQPIGLTGVAPILRVHHSRVVRVCTEPVLRSAYLERMGWGQPVLEPIVGPIKDFEIAYSEAFGLIPDWGQGSISLAGLNRALAEGGTAGAQRLATRFRLIDASRSLHRPIPLDAGDGQSLAAEKYERHPTPATGLAELLDKAANRVSVATRIPVSVLLGQQPSGLGQTGDASMRGWYDLITSVQTHYLRPALEGILRAYWGAKEPQRWKVCFEPLWTPSEAEEATTLLAQANAYEKLFGLGAITSEEIRQRLFPELAPIGPAEVEAQVAAANPAPGKAPAPSGFGGGGGAP